MSIGISETACPKARWHDVCNGGPLAAWVVRDIRVGKVAYCSLTITTNDRYNWGLAIASGGSMYAVIRSGGKQYRVEPGKTVRVETLEGKLGGKITFEDVISVHTDEKKFVSAEDISKVKIVGKIVEQGRGPKLKTLKYKTGGQYNILRGHRQNYTAVQVSDIQIP